jgi:hypothetical protein
VEQRDVPPRWEGLDEGEELRPYQEPEWRGEMRDGEMLRGEISTRVLHERIPLSRYRRRKGRHEQHNVDEVDLS